MHPASCERAALLPICACCRHGRLRCGDVTLLAELQAASAVLPEGRMEVMEPTYGGEDFSFVLNKLPGVFAFIGIG